MLNLIVSFLTIALLAILPQGKQIIPSVGGIVIRGDDYAFSICAPKGWQIDTVRWSDYAIKAGVYPLSGRVGNVPPIVVLVATKKVEGKETLKNLLAYFAKQVSEQRPKPKITDIQEFSRTQDNKTVLARRMEKGDLLEMEAYIDDANIVVMISLHPSNKDRLDEMLPPFKELVQSYVSIALDSKAPK